MSAFDDEFGLFNEEGEETERTSTLGARKIASNETIIDDVEPEDDTPRVGQALCHGEGIFKREDRIILALHQECRYGYFFQEIFIVNGECLL